MKQVECVKTFIGAAQFERARELHCSYVRHSDHNGYLFISIEVKWQIYCKKQIYQRESSYAGGESDRLAYKEMASQHPTHIKRPLNDATACEEICGSFEFFK